jgi:hypothetical protein
MVGGVVFRHDIVAAASLEAISIGTLLFPNKNPPATMPPKNTARIAKIITPLVRGDGAIRPTCFSKSSRSRRSMQNIRTRIARPENASREPGVPGEQTASIACQDCAE